MSRAREVVGPCLLSINFGMPPVPLGESPVTFGVSAVALRMLPVIQGVFAVIPRMLAIVHGMGAVALRMLTILTRAFPIGRRAGSARTAAATQLLDLQGVLVGQGVQGVKTQGLLVASVGYLVA